MSEDRAIFQQTAERLFADLVSPAVIRSAERGSVPGTLFDALHETGITAMLVPEDQGGVGADIGDAVAILRLAGHAAAPGPILETMLANRFRAAAGLPPVRIATIAFGILRDGMDEVAWPQAAESIVVVDGSLAAFTQAEDWEIVAGQDIAGEPRNQLCWVGGTVPATAAIQPGYRLAALLRGGQMLGAIDWALERSVAYAGERMQFGRPIGAFQAIQQMLAELADHALAAAAITLAAADAPGDTLIAAARSRLADAADATVTIAHQVHGAMGFSRDYALNYRTRRLMAWRDDYGSAGSWRRLLAGSFLGLGFDTLWPAITKAAADPPA